jgi:hypothetical protein
MFFRIIGILLDILFAAVAACSDKNGWLLLASVELSSVQSDLLSRKRSGSCRMHVNLAGRNRGCTGRWGVGENQSRRDPAKVAQYPAAAGLGKRF